MLVETHNPNMVPKNVPIKPIEAPARKNTRIIMPRVAPMVRKIAMSLPLSFTNIIMEEIILNAATTIISVSIRNITLRST